MHGCCCAQNKLAGSVGRRQGSRVVGLIIVMPANFPYLLPHFKPASRNKQTSEPEANTPRIYVFIEANPVRVEEGSSKPLSVSLSCAGRVVPGAPGLSRSASVLAAFLHGPINRGPIAVNAKPCPSKQPPSESTGAKVRNLNGAEVQCIRRSRRNRKLE
jgi:hypothetical protein